MMVTQTTGTTTATITVLSIHTAERRPTISVPINLSK